MLHRSEPTRLDADFIATARQAPATRFVVYAGAEALLEPELPIAPVGVTGGLLADHGVALSRSIFLGLEGQAPWFAVDIAAASDAARACCADLGRFAALGSIDDPVDGEVWALLAQARAMLAWNANSGYCSRCGAPTEMRNAGYLRACTDAACGALHFPRTDPAIIVRVTHRDRCLLARQPSFRPGLQSVLAGFAEPGESLAEAVAREVAEEVGLQVRGPDYFGSQAWPFPTSMMIAFTVEADDEEILIDGLELESAAWFTRDQVRRRLQDGRLELPSLKSISRRLIDDWLETE